MALLKAQGACYRDRSEIRHLAATPAFRFAPAAQAERPGGRQIHGQLEFGRRLHRKLGGLGALEDAIDVSTRAAKDVSCESPSKLGCGPDARASRFALMKRPTGRGSCAAPED